MEKEYSITIDGEAVAFEFKDSLIHAGGDHAGNIDAIITTKPPLPQNLLLDELHIKVPDSDEYLYIYGYGVVENSLKATFNSAALINIEELPELVKVYWGENGEQFIGDMCCQPYTKEAESKIDLEENKPEETEPKETEQIEEVKAEAKEIIEEAKPESTEAPPVEKELKVNNVIYIGATILLLLLISFLFI